MALTLKDIAKELGVAESTVSRAINNKPGVGEDTRRKILALAEKYNYKPNQMARGLAKNETGMLALLVPDLTLPSHLQIMNTIEDIASREGYQIILCNTRNNPERESSYLNLLERDQVDGAIIVGSRLANENVINTVLRGNNKIVLLNCLTEELLIPTVLIDKSEGIYLATKHLLEQRYKKIALVTADLADFGEEEKLSGYKKALKESGLKYDENYVISGNGNKEDGYKAFLQSVELPEPPHSFLVTNEFMTAGLVESIKMGGYLIPEDFAVVCYGESILTSIIEPPLTVVSEPLEEMGRVVADNLIKLIRGESPGEMIKVLKPELKVNNSSVSKVINKGKG